MFTLFGPQFVRELQQRGFDIFLDLKFHDIPNTAAHAVAAAADLGVYGSNAGNDSVGIDRFRLHFVAGWRNGIKRLAVAVFAGRLPVGITRRHGVVAG